MGDMIISIMDAFRQAHSQCSHIMTTKKKKSQCSHKIDIVR